jgi:hypothetical protein
MKYEDVKLYFENIYAERAIINNKLVAKDKRLKDSKIEMSKKSIEDKIDRTYEELIDLYKDHDRELAKYPNNDTYLRRAYGARAGGIVNRRNKLKKELSLLNE